MNKDLVGIGLSTMASGALGGLPIINLIVRSTVNVHNHAKTKWSNLYHGVILLIIVFLLAPLIQKVPLAALAILLVYTGFKLASPKVFKHVYDQGIEQLVFFVGTLVITLATDLLIGIFGGLLLALITHMLLAKVSIPTFFKMIFNSGSELITKKEGKYILKIKGIANFLGTIKINDLLLQIPRGQKVKIDLSGARLVDFSILEHLYEFQRDYAFTGGRVSITGLSKHASSSTHKLALKIMTTPVLTLTPRQVKLQKQAAVNNWSFKPEPTNHVDIYQDFYFFLSRPIETKYNCISGLDPNSDWEISDLTFEEGAFMLSEDYTTTLGLIRIGKKIPKFTIEKKDFMDKYLYWSNHKDIDYELYHDFSNDFMVKAEHAEEMKAFLNDDLKALIENCKVIHHLESNGEAILLFIDNLRLAHIHDYGKIIDFAQQLKSLIK